MRRKVDQNGPKVRVNITIRGEPAAWLTEWKQRGLVMSNTDAVLQAFRIMHEHLTEADLRKAQLRNLETEGA